MNIIPSILASIFIGLVSSAVFAGYGAKICKNPGFTCHTVKSHESWETLFPDERQRDIVMRLNRVNINIYKGMKIAIPDNLANLTIMDIAPFKKHIDPTGIKVVFVSLKELAWGAYDEKGNLIYWGPASGGKGYCDDIESSCETPGGKFFIYSKEGEDCVSTKFPIPDGGAPMPYCMFFNGGYALHGSYIVPGYNASHGCVRMFVEDAKWLNEEFSAQSRVAVYVDPN